MSETKEPSVNFETATLDTIINDVKALYLYFLEELKARNFDPRSPESLTSALTEASKFGDGKFNKLVNTYPFLVRDLAATGDCHEGALRNYFTWVGQHPWTTDEERLKVQAKYHYFKARYSEKLTERDSVRCFERAYASLIEEDKEFKEVVDRYQQQHQLTEAKVRADIIADLKQLGLNVQKS